MGVLGFLELFIAEFTRYEWEFKVHEEKKQAAQMDSY